MTRWATALLALALLAGCGDDGGSSAAPSTTADPTTTTTTSAPPATTAAPAPLPGGTLDVLIAGDSVMFDAALAIQVALESTGAVGVRVEAAFGLGISEDAGITVAEAQDELLAEQPLDQVVFMLGSWDHLAAVRDTEGYAADVRAALQALAADGRQVLLLGEPPSDPAKGEEEARQVVNEVFEAEAAAVPRVTYLPTDRVIGDDQGRYVHEVDGVLLRKPDGRHLCPAGAERFGAAVLEALRAAWQLPAPPGDWPSGSWRDDPRYDDPPGGCDPA